MMLGLRSALYLVTDLDGAKRWYADALAAFQRLLAYGASALKQPRDVGGGIIVAAVRDPFGNRSVLIENPQFDPNKVR